MRRSSCRPVIEFPILLHRLETADSYRQNRSAPPHATDREQACRSTLDSAASARSNRCGRDKARNNSSVTQATRRWPTSMHRSSLSLRRETPAKFGETPAYLQATHWAACAPALYRIGRFLSDPPAVPLQGPARRRLRSRACCPSPWAWRGSVAPGGREKNCRDCANTASISGCATPWLRRYVKPQVSYAERRVASMRVCAPSSADVNPARSTSGISLPKLFMDSSKRLAANLVSNPNARLAPPPAPLQPAMCRSRGYRRIE